MRRYRERLLEDIACANKELDKLRKQLLETASALAYCEYPEVAEEREEIMKCHQRWIGHTSLINVFTENCDTLKTAISWVQANLEVLEYLVQEDKE